MKMKTAREEPTVKFARRVVSAGLLSLLAFGGLSACSSDIASEDQSTAGSNDKTSSMEYESSESPSSEDEETGNENEDSSNEQSVDDAQVSESDKQQNTSPTDTLDDSEVLENEKQETSEVEDSENPEPVAERAPARVAKSFADGVSSDEVLSWVNAATSKMISPPTDFLGLVWPIGYALDDNPDPQVFDGDPFLQYSDVLSASEKKEVADYFKDWQAGLQGCDPREVRDFDEGAARVERWIVGSANVATAPDPCFESRSAVVAWSGEWNKLTLKQVFFHETYHGMQKYLLRQCSPVLGRQEDDMNDLRWFSEGTADYFGVYMAAKDDGRSDYVQTMLKRAYLDLRGDPGMPLKANTYVQTAAMVLMMERGMISEDKIVNGGYFTNCDWINKFDPNAPGMDYIFENFNKIEVSGGKYFYSESTISG